MMQAVIMTNGNQELRNFMNLQMLTILLLECYSSIVEEIEALKAIMFSELDVTYTPR